MTSNEVSTPIAPAVRPEPHVAAGEIARRNNSLDALRSLAILLVLGGHLVPTDVIGRGVHTITDLGARGVDLFFVLSGYLVGGIALREFLATGTVAVRGFWYRRWLRTLPAYYLTLLFYVAKQALPHRSEGLQEPLAYPVFLQSYVIGELTDFAHSWSLCVEEHFYFILPLALWGMRFLGRRRAINLLLTAGVALMFFRTLLIFQGASVDQLVSHWRTDGLVVGIALAALELQYPSFRQWLSAHASEIAVAAVLTAAAACTAQVTGSRHWQPAFAVASGLAVATAVARPPWLERIGAASVVAWTARVSYSLYLLHPLVLGAIEFLYFRQHYHRPTPLVAYVVVGTALSFLAAWLQFRFVEAPLLRWRDRNR